MSKRILATVMATAALGLAACGTSEEQNNFTVENIEELNAAADMNMDMNMDMGNMDMNMDMNTSEGGSANEAADNSTTNTGY